MSIGAKVPKIINGFVCVDDCRGGLLQGVDKQLQSRQPWHGLVEINQSDQSNPPGYPSTSRVSQLEGPTPRPARTPDLKVETTSA